MIAYIKDQIFKYKIYVKYIISGGTAATVDLGLLFIFTDWLGLWYLVSATLAFMLAFFVSFYLQKFWTFRDNNTDQIYKQMWQYLAVALMNLALNAALMFVFVDQLRLWYMLAQIFAGGIIACWSFLIYRIFIFNVKPSGEGTEK